MLLSKAFIQAIHVFVSMCVPWELNPQSFALLYALPLSHRNTVLCVTTEQSHKECVNDFYNDLAWFCEVCIGTDAFTCSDGDSVSGSTSNA